MPPERFLHLGIYKDRDNQKKNIFYSIRKRRFRNGTVQKYIWFRGENGRSFRYWNTGRLKIDMISYESHWTRRWREYLCHDGSWMPGCKMAGVAARRSILETVWKDRTYVDPFLTTGGTVKELAPRYNVAHTRASPILMPEEFRMNRAISEESIYYPLPEMTPPLEAMVDGHSENLKIRSDSNKNKLNYRPLPIGNDQPNHSILRPSLRAKTGIIHSDKSDIESDDVHGRVNPKKNSASESSPNRLASPSLFLRATPNTTRSRISSSRTASSNQGRTSCSDVHHVSIDLTNDEPLIKYPGVVDLTGDSQEIDPDDTLPTIEEDQKEDIKMLTDSRDSTIEPEARNLKTTENARDLVSDIIDASSSNDRAQQKRFEEEWQNLSRPRRRSRERLHRSFHNRDSKVTDRASAPIRRTLFTESPGFIRHRRTESPNGFSLRHRSATTLKREPQEVRPLEESAQADE